MRPIWLRVARRHYLPTEIRVPLEYGLQRWPYRCEITTSLERSLEAPEVRVTQGLIEAFVGNPHFRFICPKGAGRGKPSAQVVCYLRKRSSRDH
jgi:hypothetical protein